MQSEELLINAWEWIARIWNLELYSSGDSQIQLNQIVIALIVIFLGISISKRVTSLVGKRLSKLEKFDNNTVFILQKIVSYLFSVIVVLIAMPIAGIPITIFTVLGGALAIGVGFGAQNLFNNLMSGIILMLEKPIRIGDIIEYSGNEGRIADIGNRCVRIRRSDGIDVLLPNSYFLEQEVINWTLGDNDVRGSVSIGIAYGSDTIKAKQLMENAARGHDKVRKDMEILVLFEEFGDNALLFTVLFWTRVSRPMDLRRIQSDLRFQLNKEFNEAGIVIAFPQRDLHLDTLSPLEIKLRREDS
ncbi:MAG: mechanosensitive ion channel [Opitutales bacterium]|nr:mechanosensitive ion channel [Opitutales bacterium]